MHKKIDNLGLLYESLNENCMWYAWGMRHWYGISSLSCIIIINLVKRDLKLLSIENYYGGPTLKSNTTACYEFCTNNVFFSTSAYFVNGNT